MYLKKLSLVNFKNYESLEVEFSKGVNCFVGNNGEGKTNLLDAIHYLSLCKSYFNSVDSQNIRKGESYFILNGEYEDAADQDLIYCGVQLGKKKIFKRNKKEYSRFSEHVGKYPIVMISPSDIGLIYEGSEVRRKFIDSIISQYNSKYLETLIKYNKVLQQRNSLLKQFAERRTFDATSLSIWDDQLAVLGEFIADERQVFTQEFTSYFLEYYQMVSQISEDVSFNYSSQLHDHTLEDLLNTAQHKDRAVKYTTVGTHKDDFEFLLDGNSIKKYASQGQQKTYLLALKLAQFSFLRKHSSSMPVLLLDDIFDKLDRSRVKALLTCVCKEGFEQVFLTDTNQERTEEILADVDVAYNIFKVAEGEIT